MKVTYPHFTNLTMPLKGLFEHLGCEVILEPHNYASLQLGVKHSPELMCVPFKLAVGHTLYMLEKHEQIDSCGIICENHPCRICAYGLLFETIIKEKHRNITVFSCNYSDAIGMTKWLKAFGTKRLHWPAFLRHYSHGIQKLSILDRLERLLIQVRAAEKKARETEAYYNEAIKAVAEADSFKLLNATYRQYSRAMEENWDIKNRPHLRVLIVGEMDVQTNRFLNFDIQKRLNAMGIEVERSFWLSHVFNEFLGITRFMKNTGLPHSRAVLRASQQYLKSSVGAELTVGASALYAQKKYSGIVHLMPFGCTLETVASMVLRHISKKYGIPVLTLILDEQSGEAGVVTRIEAFADMIKQKHRIFPVYRRAGSGPN